MEKARQERWNLLYTPQFQFQHFAVTREMTVTGNGEIVAKPDYVQIQIEVRTEGENISEVQQENARIMTRVIESIIVLNIPRESIQTTVYTISPQYDFIEGRQVFRGYVVQNAITVKITDIGQAGTVIDTAIQNGANSVSSIQFELENSDSYYQQALNLALVNAMGKAKSMADMMQVPIQLIPFEIIEQSENMVPVPYRSVQMTKQEFITPIEEGQIPIKASVQVKFRY